MPAARLVHPEGKGNGGEGCLLAVRAAGHGRGDPGEAFGEDPLRTGIFVTEESPDLDPEVDGQLRPG